MLESKRTLAFSVNTIMQPKWWQSVLEPKRCHICIILSFIIVLIKVQKYGALSILITISDKSIFQIQSVIYVIFVLKSSIHLRQVIITFVYHKPNFSLFPRWSHNFSYWEFPQTHPWFKIFITFKGVIIPHPPFGY